MDKPEFFHKGNTTVKPESQIKNRDLTKLMGSNETAAAATWQQVALQNGQRGGMMVALIALMIPLGINTNPF